jgi:hypothetical protein
MRSWRASYLLLVILLCHWALVVVLSSTTTTDHAQPTSQPTAGYVAPTVPEEYIGGGLLDHPSPSPTVVPSPTIAPTAMKNPGETFEEEIGEENRTAITTSSYLFLTFVSLVGLSMLAYISKRWMLYIHMLFCMENSIIAFTMAPVLSFAQVLLGRAGSRGRAVPAGAVPRPGRVLLAQERGDGQPRRRDLCVQAPVAAAGVRHAYSGRTLSGSVVLYMCAIVKKEASFCICCGVRPGRINPA